MTTFSQTLFVQRTNISPIHRSFPCPRKGLFTEQSAWQLEIFFSEDWEKIYLIEYWSGFDISGLTILSSKKYICSVVMQYL
jgi:hypothetical protein